MGGLTATVTDGNTVLVYWALQAALRQTTWAHLLGVTWLPACRARCLSPFDVIRTISLS